WGDKGKGAQGGGGGGIFQEYGAPSRRHDDGFAEQADVAGTDEMVAPRDGLIAVLEPVLAAPAVAVELDDLLNKVPGPDRLACWLERVHPRAQRREVDTIGPGRGRGENRLAAVDLADHGPRVPVENVVVTGRRADMDIFADHRWRGDIVAIPRPAARGKSPKHLERLRVDCRDDTRSINRENLAVGNNGSRVDPVRQRHRTRQTEWCFHRCAGGNTGPEGVALKLRPLVAAPDGRGG